MTEIPLSWIVLALVLIGLVAGLPLAFELSEDRRVRLLLERLDRERKL